MISRNGGWCWFQDERALVDPATGTLLLGAVASAGGREGSGAAGTSTSTSWASIGSASPTPPGQSCSMPGSNPTTTTTPPCGAGPTAAGSPCTAATRATTSPAGGSARAPIPPFWGEERSFDWTTLFDTPEQMRRLGGGRGVTYQNVHQLDGVLHCFVRAINDDPCYLVSHDDGETWEFGGRLLAREKIGYVNGYASYASGTHLGTDDRLDLIITEHHPRDYATSIWHGYLSGGHLHRADGTRVGELGPRPRADRTAGRRPHVRAGQRLHLGRCGDEPCLDHGSAPLRRRDAGGADDRACR